MDFYDMSVNELIEYAKSGVQLEYFLKTWDNLVTLDNDQNQVIIHNRKEFREFCETIV